MASNQPASKRARTEDDVVVVGVGDDNNVADSTKPEPLTAAATTTDEAAVVVDNSNNNHNILEPIQSNVLLQSNEYAKLYSEATPFPHGIIHNFCREGFLEEILLELKHHTKVKFKETDLFRVYQSIDLGNLQEGNELVDKMPSLMKLKNAIYSPEYRAFVERITGLQAGTLTDEVDCAANCHAKGCHLLCHDDVIGTRKVSYIIYLTDAEPKWTDEDGGRLELYEAIAEEGGVGDDNADEDIGIDSITCTARFVPDALPIKTILPEFNSMAYFVVQPGVSFHSVQEVFCDRPRLSIQGWYHAEKAPSDMENATLQRLKSVGRGEDTEGVFEQLTVSSEKTSLDGGECISDGNTLSMEDRNFLGKYINATYLTDESMNEICKRFEDESSVQLRQFLLHDWSAKITRACHHEDTRDNVGNNRPSLDYHIGTNDRWKAVGPAHKQRFLEYIPRNDALDGIDPSGGAGDLLYHVRSTVFQSAAFGRWLAWISSLGFPLGQRGHIRRFRPGLDYTVAHYGVLTTYAVLDATLCFCAGAGKQCTFDEETGDLIGSDDDAIWESGDVGGFECYIAADESGEDQGPDAEYDDEDDTKLLSVSASNNTLSIVYRDPGTMRFVKYVGSGAPSSRWDIALEYELNSDETCVDESDEE